MNVLHTIPSLVPESGGTARAVVGLCEALSQYGVDVELLTLELGKQFGAPNAPHPQSVTTTFVPNRLAIGQRQLWSPRFGRTLRAIVNTKQVSLVHDHCIWLPTHAISIYEARRANLPIVVSTRGMLEPWSLMHNSVRKQLMWHIYQRRVLGHVNVLHATSASEVENLRRLKLKQPIALIPDAVESRVEARRIDDSTRNMQTILFLSRIHPKKGLLNLLLAFSKVNAEGWQLLIVGPDENGHLAEVQNIVTTLQLAQRVKFIGQVNDDAKWHYYRQADLFVLPSFSENFGLVVAEALACGVPVITTTGTPWQELKTTRSGWWVEPSVEALANALQQAMALTDAQREQMGCNGRRLIAQKYSWDVVTKQMIEVYEWLLGCGDAPACIYTR